MANLVVTVNAAGDTRLRELAELVALTREARVIRNGDCDLAVLLPLARTGVRGGKTGFARAACAWEDVDVDALKRRIRAERDAGTPSPRT